MGAQLLNSQEVVTNKTVAAWVGVGDFVDRYCPGQPKQELGRRHTPPHGNKGADIW